MSTIFVLEALITASLSTLLVFRPNKEVERAAAPLILTALLGTAVWAVGAGTKVPASTVRSIVLLLAVPVAASSLKSLFSKRL